MNVKAAWKGVLRKRTLWESRQFFPRDFQVRLSVQWQPRDLYLGVYWEGAGGWVYVYLVPVPAVPIRLAARRIPETSVYHPGNRPPRPIPVATRAAPEAVNLETIQAALRAAPAAFDPAVGRSIRENVGKYAADPLGLRTARDRHFPSYSLVDMLEQAVAPVAPHPLMYAVVRNVYEDADIRPERNG